MRALAVVVASLVSASVHGIAPQGNCDAACNDHGIFHSWRGPFPSSECGGTVVNATTLLACKQACTDMACVAIEYFGAVDDSGECRLCPAVPSEYGTAAGKSWSIYLKVLGGRRSAISDGRCEPECDTPTCGYDGGDCAAGDVADADRTRAQTQYVGGENCQDMSGGPGYTALEFAGHFFSYQYFDSGANDSAVTADGVCLASMAGGLPYAQRSGQEVVPDPKYVQRGGFCSDSSKKTKIECEAAAAGHTWVPPEGTCSIANHDFAPDCAAAGGTWSQNYELAACPTYYCQYELLACNRDTTSNGEVEMWQSAGAGKQPGGASSNLGTVSASTLPECQALCDATAACDAVEFTLATSQCVKYTMAAGACSGETALVDYGGGGMWFSRCIRRTGCLHDWWPSVLTSEQNEAVDWQHRARPLACELGGAGCSPITQRLLDCVSDFCQQDECGVTLHFGMDTYRTDVQSSQAPCSTTPKLMSPDGILTWTSPSVRRGRTDFAGYHIFGYEYWNKVSSRAQEVFTYSMMLPYMTLDASDLYCIPPITECTEDDRDCVEGYRFDDAYYCDGAPNSSPASTNNNLLEDGPDPIHPDLAFRQFNNPHCCDMYNSPVDNCVEYRLVETMNNVCADTADKYLWTPHAVEYDCYHADSWGSTTLGDVASGANLRSTNAAHISAVESMKSLLQQQEATDLLCNNCFRITAGASDDCWAVGEDNEIVMQPCDSDSVLVLREAGEMLRDASGSACVIRAEAAVAGGAEQLVLGECTWLSRAIIRPSFTEQGHMTFIHDPRQPGEMAVIHPAQDALQGDGGFRAGTTVLASSGNAVAALLAADGAKLSRDDSVSCPQGTEYTAYSYVVQPSGSDLSMQWERRACAWAGAGAGEHADGAKSFRQQYFCARYTLCTVRSGGCRVCAEGYMVHEEEGIPDDTCKKCVLVGTECDGHSTDAEVPCQAGTYNDGSHAMCQPCYSATFAAGQGAASCEQCFPGSYTNVASDGRRTSCTPCEAGYECPDGDTRRACEPGYWSGAGQRECEMCSDGYYCTNGERRMCGWDQNADPAPIELTNKYGIFSPQYATEVDAAEDCLQCSDQTCARNQYLKDCGVMLVITNRGGGYTDGNVDVTFTGATTCVQQPQADPIVNAEDGGIDGFENVNLGNCRVAPTVSIVNSNSGTGAGAEAKVDAANAGICTVCANTACDPGEYLGSYCSGDVGTTGEDVSQCTNCTTCGIGKFMSGCGGAATPTSPGTCTDCRTCPSGEHRSPECTATGMTEDTTCVPCDACGEDSYMPLCPNGGSCECTGKTSTDCLACNRTQCADGQYLHDCGCHASLGNLSNPDSFGCSPGECRSCTACPAGKRMLEACAGNENLAYDPGADPEHKCVDCGVCSENYYRDGCVTNDDVPGTCVACKTSNDCGANHYIDPSTRCTGASLTDTSVCRACEPCEDTADGLQQWRRGCGGVSPGHCEPVSHCLAEYMYEVAAPTNFTDRQCTGCSHCDWATQYASVICGGEGHATDDYTCKPVRNCTAGQFQSKMATHKSDAVCSPFTPCTASTEYESFAPVPYISPASGGQDRKCTAYTLCKSYEYETAAPVNSTDRQCTPRRQCTNKQYASSEGTETTDRQCTDITECGLGLNNTDVEFRLERYTRTTDSVCVPCTDFSSKSQLAASYPSDEYTSGTKQWELLCYVVAPTVPGESADYTVEIAIGITVFTLIALPLLYAWYRKHRGMKILALVTDADGDGDHDVDDVLAAFDTNKDGQVSRDELQSMMDAEEDSVADHAGRLKRQMTAKIKVAAPTFESL